jgi:hypothetical protein
LGPLKEKFLSLSQAVDCHIPNSPIASIVDGKLSISREKGQWLSNRQEVKQLKRDVVALLPQIKLTDLLIEVDQWTHFTRHFTSLADREPRTQTLQKSLFANFMASGCNIGLVNMADSTPDITYRQLFHVSTWYITDETLHKAMTEIINFHHRLPLASVWANLSTVVHRGRVRRAMEPNPLPTACGLMSRSMRLGQNSIRNTLASMDGGDPLFVSLRPVCGV